jgi:phosphoserine phosphatase
LSSNAASAIKASEFVELVLSLNPQIATLDCDGTLWLGDAGERFFDWELREKLVSDKVIHWARSRYAEYKGGKVPEEVICGEMVTMHQGLKASDVQRAAIRFFDEKFVDEIFPEMRELVRRLQESGCEVWAVSSTNEWVIQAAMRHFGIAKNRILAASTEVKDGVITDRLIRVPSGPGKPQAIREMLRGIPDVAFGNSIWDVEMLKMAKHPVAVNPTQELLQIAGHENWKIYRPELSITE